MDTGCHEIILPEMASGSLILFGDGRGVIILGRSALFDTDSDFVIGLKMFLAENIEGSLNHIESSWIAYSVHKSYQGKRLDTELAVIATVLDTAFFYASELRDLYMYACKDTSPIRRAEYAY